MFWAMYNICKQTCIFQTTRTTKRQLGRLGTYLERFLVKIKSGNVWNHFPIFRYDHYNPFWFKNYKFLGAPNLLKCYEVIKSQGVRPFEQMSNNEAQKTSLGHTAPRIYGGELFLSWLFSWISAAAPAGNWG